MDGWTDSELILYFLSTEDIIKDNPLFLLQFITTLTVGVSI
jgi:hypothetical protein